LKLLKTRTALIMNGLAEFRLRYTRQGAKRLQNKGVKPATNISKKSRKNIDFFSKNMIKLTKQKFSRKKEVDKNA
jgi:hypothetical protein